MTDTVDGAAPALRHAADSPVVEVMGIRHHGPGSARAVRAALDRLHPDMVLIEGPADADALTAFAGDVGLEPPVALLAYATDAPRVSAFWPFALFSPEWQALRWAAEHGVEVRFCDLPSSVMLAQDDAPVPSDPASPGELRRDPIAVLAAAAGYSDPERWWDDVVEARLDAPTPFPVITEAMTELRASAQVLAPHEQQREDRREAHMRQVLRAALRDGAVRVAVVCGAWHAPALEGKLPAASVDARLLRAMPQRKTAITWIPWTSSRLAFASGYGAGIDSPGWYHHLFVTPDRVVTRWLVIVAGVLRAEDLPVSSASVIEAVRLAEAIASMRGRPLAGLDEVTEATRAVLCDGDEVMLSLVAGRLVVGEGIGSVPEGVPTVPLASDLQAVAKRLRLKQEAHERLLELDLRKPLDLERSRLAHRLQLLTIPWLTTARAASSSGTFRESWHLAWAPELAVALIEAAMWGTTVVSAATAKVADAATTASLPELTALVERSLLAELPEALTALLSALEERTAHDLDVAHLMGALPPLVRAHRYSDVRATDTSQLARIADALVIRICAALPAAVTSLDDDAARLLRDSIDATHNAVMLRDDPRVGDQWLGVLGTLSLRSDISGVLSGRLTRLLRDTGRIDPAEAALRLSRALSIGVTAPAKAAWIEGFFDGGGLLLAHDADLLALLDTWLSSLAEQSFTDVLPLLRRTFGGFPAAQRRAIGDAVRRVSTRPDVRTLQDLDEERALAALATAALIFGVQR